MFKLRNFCLIIVAALLLPHSGVPGQESTTSIAHSLGDDKPWPWTRLPAQAPPAEFQFAVVSDNSGTPRPGVWREAMNKLNLLNPEFVMSVGDLIEGYVSTREQLDAQWDQFMSDLAPLESPFFFVAGNHDVGKPLWYQTYRERIGPTWYYFVYRDVLFLVLDTNDGKDHGTGMSDQQIAWAEQVLRDIPASQVKWTMVFQHKPLWNDQHPQWMRVKQMLADRQRVTVLAGHIHEYMSTLVDGIEHVALATTGGGSPLRGKDAGEIDHITWVTMKDDGPVVANLQLDGILPIDFRTNQSARRYQSLSQGVFLSVPAFDHGQSEFLKGQTVARIKNPDDQPLRLKVLIEPPNGVIVRPAAISTVIDAKSEYSVELTVVADNPIAAGSMQPVVLHWQASYDQPSAPALTWSGSCSLYLDGVNTIAKTQPKVIDGNLDDWPELTHLVDQPGEIYTNAQAWRGVHDARFRFGLAADDSHLYCAIEVADDQVVHDGQMVWQDFVGLFVNPLVDPSAKPEEIRKEAFAVMAGLSMSQEDLRRYQFGNPPQDVQSQVRQHDKTIAYEFSIPTERFSQLQNGPWKRLQINVIVSDHDTDDQRHGLSILYWRPRWDGLFHYAGSGIFQRQQ